MLTADARIDNRAELIPLLGLTDRPAADITDSDLILAAQLFNDLSFSLIGDVIWLTYGPGQMLIVYSAATAVALIQKSMPT